MGKKAKVGSSLFEMIPIGVVYCDAQGTILDANPVACETYGAPHDKLVGQPFLDKKQKAIREDGSELSLDELPVTVAFKTGESVVGVVLGYFSPTRGELRWFLVQAVPEFEDESAQPSVVCLSFLDITDRKRAEAILLESQEKLLSVVSAAPMGVYIFRLTEDHNLVLQGSNPSADKILGVPNAQYVGKAIEEAFPSLVQTEIPEKFREVIQTGQVWQDEQMNYEDDVIKGAFEVTAFRISPDSMAVMFLDITERQRHLEERQQLRDQLLQSQKMEAIGRLAGGIAHDFNNILTGITGYTELVLSRIDHDHDAFADVSEIRKAALKAGGLTHQLLEFSRKQVLNPVVVDLSVAIADSVNLLSRLIGEDIELVYYPNTDLWGVRLDATQLDQILVNLCTNSRDAMPNGGNITIGARNVGRGDPVLDEIRPPKDGDYVLIDLKDSGEGMDEETRDKIFDPFYSTKKKGEGVGLGLSTVHGIVQQNGGAIDVISRRGEGTRFRILLPRVAEQASDTPRAAVPTASTTHGVETILLVEDEKMVRRVVSRMLEQMGYRVLVAEEGAEALKAEEAHEGRIDLLITDVVMPNMNGKQLYDLLTKRRPHLKCLFISGYSGKVIEHHGIDKSETFFLQKPFRNEVLLQTVREILDA